MRSRWSLAPSPEFYRWAFASMWTPGPFESKPSRAYYYLTDADRSWPSERQKEHLRDFNIPTLWNISIHEVYPGHFLHFQHLRQVESKVRKSTLFAPVSFVEGWAHYCEQMMIEAGSGAARYTHQARTAGRVAGAPRAIRRRHPPALRGSVGGAGDAVLPRRGVSRGSDARREAERGTFDPGYLVYSAGKLMLLKLRRDFKEQQAEVLAAGFHDALLGQGCAPFWAHRTLLLGRRQPDACWSRTAMPLSDFECEACG